MFIFLPASSNNWLLRTRNGKREASWRMWLLIFLLPVCLFCAAIFLSFQSFYFQARSSRALGEVVRVYAWDDWNPWDGETTSYGPVFRYQFTDGSWTEASTGQSSPNWNFVQGSTHEILFLKGQKSDVRLNNFESFWAVALIISALGFLALIPSIAAAWLLKRWLNSGP